MKKLLVALLCFASAALCFARDTLSLDMALENMGAYFAERITAYTAKFSGEDADADAPVVVLPITADAERYKRVCERIQDDLIELLENGKVTVVDRRNTEEIDAEISYQQDSGYVDEDKANSLGEALGGRIILFGSWAKSGSGYRLTLSATDVRTRQVIGSRSLEVRHDGWIESRLPTHIFHVGVRGGYVMHTYTMSDSFTAALSGKNMAYNFLFGAAQASVYFTDNVALQTGLIYNRDIVEYSGVETYMETQHPYKATFDSTSLIVPALVRYDFRPGLFVLGIMVGPYFTIPLGSMKYNVRYSTGYLYEGKDMDYAYSIPLGIMIGGSAGMRLGPGSLFADVRYGIDLGNVSIASYGILDVYKRFFISFTLGYEFGFLERRIK
ncbi:MAG: outer membrane beta-barrel protein [Treponema sp.]|jgi:TolB-like protein|nr:outer membrane beta-barrel protein [Treponema sp.]